MPASAPGARGARGPGRATARASAARLAVAAAAAWLAACGGGGNAAAPTTVLTNPGDTVVAARTAEVAAAAQTRALPARRVDVATEAALRAALADANARGGNVTIVLADGVYALRDTLYVNAPDVAFVSASGDRTKVVLRGDAMGPTARVKNLVRVAGARFQLRGLSLERAGWHLIQIAGESDADDVLIRDCAMRDAWEQLFKVSVDPSRPGVTADNGVVERCVFEYTAGIGPQYYIGGIDAHGSKHWVVRDNEFRGIASPSRSIAEHAIHFWNGSAHVLVERNVIVDCDRGIGFGMAERGNAGGVIRNNYVHHTANAHPFADTGIVLENSPGTAVYNNTVLLEHAYPNAIEYRFPGTRDVTIRNNLVNRRIHARDGGSATLGTNVTTASRATFRLSRPGDLALGAPHPGIVDAGAALAGLTDDIEREARPKGAGVDVGADEL